MKRIVAFFFALLTLIFLGSSGFSPSLIQGPLLETPSSPPSSVDCILNQPFRYLGQGRQCFVFESADGQYVLKFFNQKYFNMPWYAHLWKPTEQRKKRGQRRHFYEQSYAIAFQEFGEEILYLHREHSTSLPTISLQTKYGYRYWLDLNEVPFVLQKKGIPFYEGLQQVYQREGEMGLCREIDHFLALIAGRIQKGIADADADVEHNWGYLDGHIFHLDPGRLYYDETLCSAPRRSQEWQTATRRFSKWLKIHYPGLVEHFECQLSLYN